METYKAVIKDGCDHNCEMCDLWLFSRDECWFEFEKRWQQWADKQHEEFADTLKETK